MSKIYFILTLFIPFIKSLFKEHRPVYIPDKNLTFDSGLYNTKSRFLDESSSISKIQYTNPISYQYIISDGLIENLTFTLKAVNLSSGYYYNYASLKYPSSSNISIINIEFLEQETNYTFSSTNQLKFYFKLKNEETLTIKMKMKYNENITSLFKSEYIYIPSFFVGTCKYNFEIVNAKNLGLLYGNFDKLSSNIYYYEGDCPGKTYYDYIRTSPYKVTWKTYRELNLLGTKISYTELTMPAYYKGGNNFNYSEYLIDSTETNGTQKVTDNNTHIQFTYSNISETSLSFKLKATFTNYITNNWIIYYSDDQIKNISTENSISLVKEILENDTSSNPSYYKIGKWIYWNIDYNSSYLSKNFTVDEIIKNRIGVCEHFSILYIALLNSIGIKAVYIHGFSAEENDIYSNNYVNTSYGHGWIAAYIDDKWIGLDATWGIVEGNLPISHLYYSAIYGSVNASFKGTNVKWGKNKFEVQFVEVVDIICDYNQVNIDGECMLCVEFDENKPYLDIKESICISECNNVLYNNICYESCEDLNTNDKSYENVDGYCVEKINKNKDNSKSKSTNNENNSEDTNNNNNSVNISNENNSTNNTEDNINDEDLQTNSNNESTLKTNEDIEQTTNNINIINESSNCNYLLVKKQIFGILIIMILL